MYFQSYKINYIIDFLQAKSMEFQILPQPYKISQILRLILKDLGWLGLMYSCIWQQARSYTHIEAVLSTSPMMYITNAVQSTKHLS